MMSRVVVLLAVVSILLGCGSDPGYQGAQRFALSGKVTLDGVPIDGGTISFLPSGRGNPAGGPIVGGAYSVPEDRGANEGPHSVQISWMKPTGEKVKDEDTGGMIDVVKEVVPAKYNTQTELKADVAAGKTTFDFDLKSK